MLYNIPMRALMQLTHKLVTLLFLSSEYKWLCCLDALERENRFRERGTVGKTGFSPLSEATAHFGQP